MHGGTSSAQHPEYDGDGFEEAHGPAGQALNCESPEYLEFCGSSENKRLRGKPKGESKGGKAGAASP